MSVIPLNARQPSIAAPTMRTWPTVGGVASVKVEVVPPPVYTGPPISVQVCAGGGLVTVKSRPLLATPPTVTTTLPVVTPLGTTAVMLVELQLVMRAFVPLKVTVLVP